MTAFADYGLEPPQRIFPDDDDSYRANIVRRSRRANMPLLRLHDEALVLCHGVESCFEGIVCDGRWNRVRDADRFAA